MVAQVAPTTTDHAQIAVVAVITTSIVVPQLRANHVAHFSWSDRSPAASACYCAYYAHTVHTIGLTPDQRDCHYYSVCRGYLAVSLFPIRVFVSIVGTL